MEAVSKKLRDQITVQNFIHVSGLPCAGKTWLRRRIQRLARFQAVDIDLLWHELFDSPEYSKEQSEYVFAEFLKRIEKHLKNGVSVIAESVLASESRLLQLEQMASSMGVRHLFVMAEATRETLISRLQKKALRRRNSTPMAAFEDFERRFETRPRANLIFETTNGVSRDALQPLNTWIHGASIHPN